MTKTLHRTLVAGGLLVALSLAAPPASGQTLEDSVITLAYFNVKSEHASAWLGLFKKHFQPALEELKQQGALRVYHVFVPGVHHPGYRWTHALALAHKDRAAQAAVEKKLLEALAAMPADEAKTFIGAIDRELHFDDEWREVNLEAVSVPEEKKEEKK